MSKGGYGLQHVIDGAGGDKLVSLRRLLDNLEIRAIIVGREICVPGLPTDKTEFLRGKYHEIQSLIKAIKETLPGSDDPNL